MADLFYPFCPYCGSLLAYVKTQDYWECTNPECKGEVWYNDMSRAGEVTKKEARDVWRAEQAYKKQLCQFGGSPKTSRVRKKKPKFVPTWARNFEHEP